MGMPTGWLLSRENMARKGCQRYWIKHTPGCWMALADITSGGRRERV
jgi:hypothetical protein